MVSGTRRPTGARSRGGVVASLSGAIDLVLIVLVVVAIAVVATIPVAAAALPPHLFQFLAALVRLSAVLAVALNGIAQPFFCLMNAPLAFVVPIRPCRHRRTHQTGEGQHCNAQNLDCTSYSLSLNYC